MNRSKVVSSNPDYSEVYLVQFYVKKLSVTATGRCFFPCISVSSTNKTDRHDITEILLKIALNTITLTLGKKWRVYTYCIGQDPSLLYLCFRPVVIVVFLQKNNWEDSVSVLHYHSWHHNIFKKIISFVFIQF